MAVGRPMSPRNGAQPDSRMCWWALWSSGILLLAFSGTLLVLALGPASTSSIDQVKRVLAAAVSPAAPPPAPPTAGWNPMMLPMEDRRWVHDWVREKVPSMVTLPRRQLTMELAVGALLAGIAGDIVECGVALGGTSILLAKVLQKYDPASRRVLWAADSFDGLPAPTQQDANGTLLVGQRGQYNSSEQAFQANLLAHGVPHSRIRVLKGWFNESLPGSGIQRIAFLRLDGDMYVSTLDPLEALYDRVTPGGLIYIDDYGSFNGCRRAVDEFRARRGITSPLQVQAIADSGYGKPAANSSWEAVWWVKTGTGTLA